MKDIVLCISKGCGIPGKTFGSLDIQVSGNHYKNRSIQPVEYIHYNGLNFCEGNVVKYVTRWRDKNGLADLTKSKHYVELLYDLSAEEDRKNGAIFIEKNINISPKEYSISNSLSELEGRIIDGITLWDQNPSESKYDNLLEVHSDIKKLIDYHQQEKAGLKDINMVALGNFTDG